MIICNTYRVILHFLNLNGNHFTCQSGGFFGWNLTEEINCVNNYPSEKEARNEAYKYGNIEHMTYNIHREKDSNKLYVGFHIEPYKLEYISEYGNEVVLVKKLRELTNLGLMKCKILLQENDWDIEKAIKAAKTIHGDFKW